MSCTNCYDLCGVVLGDPTYTIGSIADLSTAVLVYVENVGTGRIDIQEVTTDGSGNVDVDLTQAYFDAGQSYRFRVSELWYGSDYKDITPPAGGVVTYTCMVLSAKKAC